MRLAVNLTIGCLSMVGLALAGGAEASIRKPTHIPAQDLASALQELAKERDLQVVYRTAVIGGQKSHGVSGQLTSNEALDQLLSGTGLTFRYLDDKTVTIIAAPVAPSSLPTVTGAGVGTTANGSLPQDSQGSRSEEGALQNDFWERFRVAQALQGTATSDSTVGGKQLGQGSDQGSESIQEVIVTAQKRAERLQDVPVPVTEIDASTLVEAHQFRIQDYFATVPGLSMNSYGDGSAQLAIRGVTTAGNTNPTVSVLIDDIPVSGSSAVTDNASYIPDIDPSDLSSVEVLRGPQGTLYGAASLGGLLKYVTADPSTDRFSGRVQADLSKTYNGDGLGYGVRGSVNIPLTDTFAVRVSAFNRDDAGFINNPSLNSDGTNRDHVDGGRVSAMWKPSDSFSVKLAAIIQDTNANNVSEEEISAVEPQGDLQQNFMRGSGPLSEHFRLYGATIKAQFAGLDFTSVTGYSVNSDDQFSDLSGFQANALLYNSSRTEKFTQEIRLSSSVGKVFDWLVGGFFDHEYSPVIQQINQVDLDTGLPIPGGQLIQFDFPLSISDYAAFADGTIHFTDQFDLQIGGRESRNKQIFNETDTGPDVFEFDGVTSPAILKTVRTTDDSFTYLVTPEFKFTPDLMVYARAASGYRPGGPNSNAALNPTAQKVFGPDKTQNFEVGLKGDVFDHVLALDSSVYYIKWQNIQTQVDNNYGAAFFTNGGDAKSEGVELSQQLRPISGLTIAAWEAWNEAVLTTAFPNNTQIHGAYGEPGDRLPFSPRWSANFSINQEFSLIGNLSGYVRASAAYVGQRVAPFQGSVTTPRFTLSGYVEPNFIAGIRSGAWTVDVFARNFTDRRGEVLAGTFNQYNAYTYIQPRTIGVSFAYAF